jgi:hypothetical protein
MLMRVRTMTNERGPGTNRTVDLVTESFDYQRRFFFSALGNCADAIDSLRSPLL